MGDRYYGGKMSLSVEQKMKIKRLNQEMGQQFAAIGKDRSLSGYEKGQKKRALAMKKREAIYKILTTDQKELWDGNSEEAASLSYLYDISDKYDNMLDNLEDQYEADKDLIENDYTLSKEERKAKEKALKRVYKTQKEKLKREKNTAKRGAY